MENECVTVEWLDCLHFFQDTSNEETGEKELGAANLVCLFISVTDIKTLLK